MSRLPCLFLLLSLCPALPAAAPPRVKAKKKIVLIAGKKSHGPEGNGIHDYPWSVKLLKVMLDHSNIKDRVTVEYHLNGWPRDPDRPSGADVRDGGPAKTRGGAREAKRAP